MRREFGITQPAVSKHLRVLRDAGFATSTPRGQQRLYRRGHPTEKEKT